MKRNPIFILINDIHIDKQKGELVKDIFRQVFEIAKSKKIYTIIIGGDVFTNRSGQPLDCLSAFQDIVSEARDRNIDIIAIPGNHDKTDPDDNRSYLDIYRGNNNLTVKDRASLVTFNDCCVALIPYFGEEKWLQELKDITEKIDKSIKTSSRILITHIGFDGVKNNDGSEVCSILKSDSVTCFDKVLVGHYHDASKVGKNIYYTGSAYQNNYGEGIIDKGCTIVYNDATTEHVDLKFPKYIKHVIDVNDSETLRNLIEKYEGEDYDHVRFIFQGKKVDASKVDLNFISSKGIECQFESIEEKEAINDSINIDSLNYDKRSISKDFLKFCSENQIKGKHMKYGLNLIKGI